MGLKTLNVFKSPANLRVAGINNLTKISFS